MAAFLDSPESDGLKGDETRTRIENTIRWQAEKTRVEEVTKIEALKERLKWDGRESVNAYAKRTGLAEFKSINVGGGIELKLALIPGGKFIMGSPPNESERHDNEKLHVVTISLPFYMAVFETTQEQYRAVMHKNPSNFHDDPKQPVESVSWDNASDFCQTLSALSKVQIRLPTEAEWELACRAGSRTRFYSGDSETDLSAVALVL